MFSLTENNNLFGENIFEYDIYELANWIYRCKYRYVNIKTKAEKVEAEKFISDWLEHRELHKQFYESDIYQEALIASNYKRPTIYAKHGKKRVDISELIYPNRMASTGTLPSLSTANAEEFAEILKNNVAETVDNYFELIEHCFHTPTDYKENIDNILKTFFKESYVLLDIVSIPKNTDISKLTKDEMIDILKKQVFCEKLVCLKQRIRAPDFCLKKAKSSLYMLFSIERLEVVCSSENLEFSRKTAYFGLFLLQI